MADDIFYTLQGNISYKNIFNNIITILCDFLVDMKIDIIPDDKLCTCC